MAKDRMERRNQALKERFDGGSAADRRKRDRAGGRTPAERFNWDVQRVLDWAKACNGSAYANSNVQPGIISYFYFWTEEPPIKREQKPKVWLAVAIITAMERFALCEVLEDWT